MIRLLLCVAVVATGLAACDSPPVSTSPQTGTAATTTTTTTTTTTPAPVLTGPIADCPVTKPVKATDPVPPGALFGGNSAYGNADLWVGGLGDGGVMRLRPEPGQDLGNKLGWYRIATGKLTITGRRLDGQAPPLRSEVPEGYGDSGFQSSGVYFASEGCWEITGTVGKARLTFVTYVVRA